MRVKFMTVYSAKNDVTVQEVTQLQIEVIA